MKNYRIIFISAALCIYAAAILPLIILMGEYQNDAWILASSYSPMFLFPITFLLFILPALYVPVRDYLQFTFNNWREKPQQKKRWWLFFPIPVTIIVALFATVAEISQPTMAIWEINPSQSSPSLKSVTYEGINMAGAGSALSLHLFMQLRAAKAQLDRLPEQSNDRSNLAQTIEEGKREYLKFLDLKRLGADKNGITPSKTRAFYIASFFTVFFVAALTLALIVFFSALHMAVGNERAKFRGTCFSLTAATFCFLAWIPMRAATTEVKRSLYPSSEIAIFGDILITIMFFIAATAIALSWFVEHKERVIGVITVLGPVISLLVSFFAGAALLHVFEVPKFYIGFVILALFPVMGIFLYNKFRLL